MICRSLLDRSFFAASFSNKNRSVIALKVTMAVSG